MNIGIVTGKGSGIVVLDVDPRNGGDECLAELIAPYGSLPETVQVRTGGGGRHFYFAHPGGSVPSRQLGPGLELKADGAFVVAPPSEHASGASYSWAGKGLILDSVAACPEWLLESTEPSSKAEADSQRPVLTPDSGRGRGVRWQRNARLSHYAQAAVQTEVEKIRAAREGNRNRQLNESSFNLGQLVGSDLIEVELVASVLLEAALHCGLPDDEARRTIASGLTAGIARPRRVA